MLVFIEQLMLFIGFRKIRSLRDVAPLWPQWASGHMFLKLFIGNINILSVFLMIREILVSTSPQKLVYYVNKHLRSNIFDLGSLIFVLYWLSYMPVGPKGPANLHLAHLWNEGSVFWSPDNLMSLAPEDVRCKHCVGAVPLPLLQRVCGIEIGLARCKWSWHSANG